MKATLLPGSPSTLYSADHALSVSIQALQIDKDAHRWQGQAYIVSGGKTEAVKPVAGYYEAMLSVPVLIRQVGSTDVIAQGDIEMKSMPERQIRKDTVTDEAQLIGKSPRRTISAERPIRAEEIAMPLVVKKGQTVELTYTTPYVHIRTEAEALEDGAVGATIRVKNTKSGKAVSSRVVDTGHVEANIGEM
ncbi:MAG: flagellar basal body P-ring formation chaperone FlgA [Alphaproteobacteria bacterium]